MLPQSAYYDSGLRGIPLFDSSRRGGLQRPLPDLQYLPPDGIQPRDDKPAGGAPRQLGPPQYAHPVRVNPPAHHRQPSLTSETGDGSHLTNPEHMLRRKTPNGTLAAGYDGAPVHWSTSPPPLKHVVLPFGDRFAHNQNGGSGLRAPIQRSYSDNASWNAADTQWEVESAFQTHTQLPMMDLDDQAISSIVYMNGQQFVRNGPEVPTVLQPPYQPSLGPTASNDAGTYGPYYVHGRPQAYRPAAVRDTALHPFNPCPGPIFAAHDDNYLSVSRNWSLNGIRSMVPDGYGSERGLADIGTQAVGQGFNGTSLPFRPQQQSSSLKFVPAQIIQNHRQTSFSHRNQNAQFKERILGWAHGIYVDLLTSIYKTKREAQQARKKHGIHRSYSHTSIYPRPPRQTAFLMRRPSDPAYYSDGICKQTLNGHRYSPTMLQETDIRRRRSNSIVSIMEDKRSYASRMSPSVRAVEGSYFVPSHQHGGHGQSPLSLYLNTTSPRPGTLQDTAGSALEMLETLCHESSWRWVDGMLLGGCLAYGLGDYERALEWYSKIIAIDPRYDDFAQN